MDPTTVFCPNRHCHAGGQVGMGKSVAIRARSSAASATSVISPAAPATVPSSIGCAPRQRPWSSWVTLLAHGCPLQAIVAALGFDERTIADWGARSGRQGQAVHEYLVEQPRDWGQGQADELRVKQQGGMV